mgnify:CR=1 FL=1
MSWISAEEHRKRFIILFKVEAPMSIGPIITFTNPQVLHSPITYTRTSPSGPCTPMRWLNALYRYFKSTHVLINLRAHNGDDIE